MIDSFLRAFQNTREHWVFWPFILLILQIVLYNFLLSKNGYLSYLEKIKERQAIQLQIDDLIKKKAELGKKLAHVENDEVVIKEFIRRLYFYDDKYTIVKFMDEQKPKEEVKESKMDLVFIQRAYILIASIAFAIFTALFWKRHNNSIPNEV